MNLGKRSEPCLAFSFADLLLRTPHSHSTYYIYLYRYFRFFPKVIAFTNNFWTKDVCLKSLLTYSVNAEKQYILRKKQIYLTSSLSQPFWHFNPIVKDVPIQEYLRQVSFPCSKPQLLLSENCELFWLSKKVHFNVMSHALMLLWHFS